MAMPEISVVLPLLLLVLFSVTAATPAAAMTESPPESAGTPRRMGQSGEPASARSNPRLPPSPIPNINPGNSPRVSNSHPGNRNPQSASPYRYNRACQTYDRCRTSRYYGGRS
ncbi:hypothetical protein Taro_021847 [Colocasia esculenta]|uniref:Uncharacterized protein n=1 Tax=Colocasia esculenta TaxID=4460 RepID=A0A843UZW8_COLES|nr:hypothetical protein [Colocasia esculenta]